MHLNNMALYLSYIILVVYALAIIIIFLYSLSLLNLMINYVKSFAKKTNAPMYNFDHDAEIPLVTIQLPIFNEKYVVERLLNAVVLLQYPLHKLEIQVLDDSTDDSLPFTTQLVEKFIRQGYDIKHITRTNRTGFKAGALKEGLAIAKGNFIAIFDADFVPTPNWLYKTIPYFKDESIGVVQTRWGHLNRNFSILTKIQAFALDAHFTIEQVGRNANSHFINFNGTAGVWRKTCIINAGNWQSDTLTEDLDLSYRAQLNNWKFKYLVDVETPAELPAIISAVRSQQFRWNKGGAENFRKVATKVIQSKALRSKSKFHALLHLLNSSMFLCIFTLAVLSVPVLFIKNTYSHLAIFFDVLIFFFITSLIFFICYWISYKNIVGGGFKNFIQYICQFFVFYSIAMGFSLQNTIAVLEGLTGKKSDFIRTPKLNIEGLKDSWRQNIYLSKKIPKISFVEGLLACYFIFGIYTGVRMHDFGLFPFHIMLSLGFGYVCIKSLRGI